MFSVITHQAPEEASLTLAQLRRVAKARGRLYFTAFVDEEVDGYTERIQDKPGMMSTYAPDTLIALVEPEGWRIDAFIQKINYNSTQSSARQCSRFVNASAVQLSSGKSWNHDLPDPQMQHFESRISILVLPWTLRVKRKAGSRGQDYCPPEARICARTASASAVRLARSYNSAAAFQTDRAVARSPRSR
jgi:hypothetical protein